MWWSKQLVVNDTYDDNEHSNENEDNIFSLELYEIIPNIIIQIMFYQVVLNMGDLWGLRDF